MVGVAFEYVQGTQFYGVAAELAGLYHAAPLVALTRYGQSLGRLVLGPYEAERANLPTERAHLATESDIYQAAENAQAAASALARCRELVFRHDLPMRLAQAYLALDRRQITFFFRAPGRIDFRLLLRDLVREMPAPVRLEQVGERDVARILGGVGRCGQQVCCRTWMPHFDPVSIKHARQQDLPPAPSQLGGLCGKLRCCLRFEIDPDDEFDRPRRAYDGTTPVKTASFRVTDDDAPL